MCIYFLHVAETAQSV